MLSEVTQKKDKQQKDIPLVWVYRITKQGNVML